jgi:hypothetical protein
MEEVYNSKGMTNADKEKKMYHDYHGFADDGTNGDENIVGYLDQLLEGTNQFSGLYDREDLEINDASNEERGQSERLVLKQKMHRESKRLVVGKELTKEILQGSTLKRNAPLITGRTLKTHAESAHRNGKKALAIALQYLRDGNLPSGATDEDYETHLLDQMYIELKGMKDTPGSSGDDDDDDGADDSFDPASIRPESWMFHGYMAFLLLGPRGNDKYQSTLFAIDDLKVAKGGSKKDNGREAKRKQEKLERSLKRSVAAGAGGSPFKRGMSIENRTSLEHKGNLASVKLHSGKVHGVPHYEQIGAGGTHSRYAAKF